MTSCRAAYRLLKSERAVIRMSFLFVLCFGEACLVAGLTMYADIPVSINYAPCDSLLWICMHDPDTAVLTTSICCRVFALFWRCALTTAACRRCPGSSATFSSWATNWRARHTITRWPAATTQPLAGACPSSWLSFHWSGRTTPSSTRSSKWTAQLRLACVMCYLPSQNWKYLIKKNSKIHVAEAAD